MGDNLIELNVAHFLEEVASRRPVPGGGCVAALGGALAAALVSMVCRLTIGRKGYEDVDEEIKHLLKKSEKLRKRLSHLVDEDAQSYQKVIASHSTKKELTETSLKQATTIPLKTALLSKQISTLAYLVYQKGSKVASSDAKVASLFAEASVKGALENVTINLRSIKDKRFKKRVVDKIRQIKPDHFSQLENTD